MTAPADQNVDGTLATDVDAYRDALRRHLRTSRELGEWRGASYPSTEERLAAHSRLMAHLYELGLNRFGWPVEAGGLGGDERHRAVLYDELLAHDLPAPEPQYAIETLGPPVIRFAPRLAAELLPGFLRGDELWGQGFSEPEAGSDLASLRCRARRAGDTYVVSGQKIWTSYGAQAKRFVCLVRTGTPESRHRGLSMIMIDGDLTGVTVRPIALPSGMNELAEVFFDDVVVPASRLIGKENEGWAVAMYLIQFERAMYAWTLSGLVRRQLQKARARLQTPTARRQESERFGNVYADLVALRARSATTVRKLATGRPVGPEASVDKILLATADIAAYDLVRHVSGPEFLFDDTEEAADLRAEWWYSRSATILGGSSEIQRTILADHVLGLPKEAAQ